MCVRLTRSGVQNTIGRELGSKPTSEAVHRPAPGEPIAGSDRVGQSGRRREVNGRQAHWLCEKLHRLVGQAYTALNASFCSGEKSIPQ